MLQPSKSSAVLHPTSYHSNRLFGDSTHESGVCCMPTTMQTKSSFEPVPEPSEPSLLAYSSNNYL